jgi:hypothetical protein
MKWQTTLRMDKGTTRIRHSAAEQQKQHNIREIGAGSTHAEHHPSHD